MKGCGKGSTVMVGYDLVSFLKPRSNCAQKLTTYSGFGLSGIPENIIEWVREQPEITDLKIISTEAGDNKWGLGRLYEKDKIAKQWASFIGRAKVMEQAYLTGKTELELIPQGTVCSLPFSDTGHNRQLTCESWQRKFAVRASVYQLSTL